jgi:hypothetical protein
MRTPGARWWLGVPLYALAATPGLSRMYLGQHWASDIFAGAFMGTFAGEKVVRYSHSHPHNRFQDFFVPPGGLNVSMDGGRAGLSWTLEF